MKTKFDFFDYFIFFLILVVSILIGLYFGFHINEKVKKLLKGLVFRPKSSRVSAANTDTDTDDKETNDIGMEELPKKDQLDKELEASVENEPNVPSDDSIKANNETKNRTMEYLTANNSMGAFPIALSILSTFFSSSSLLGFPAEVYQFGIQYWIIVFGVTLLPLVGAFATGPFFAYLKVVSIFEYLKMRFDSEAARLLGVTLYLIRILIAMGIVIYGPATALSSLTELSNEVAILLIGLIATFYTTIGGIKAVIWTDTFQTLIMFAGVIAVIIKGTVDVGGISNLFEINYKGGRLNFFNFDPDPLIRQSFWSLTIGGTIAWSMSYALDQQLIQRFSAAKSRKTAQLALMLNIPGVFLLISLCCLAGLVLYANFSTCDPLSASVNQYTGVKNPNQLMPYFVMLKFNSIIFVPGLFLSSIFCASLSSVSSALNSMSACIWRDYLMRLKFFKNASDSKSSVTTKITALICGFICTALGFLISRSDSNLIQISSTINGSLQAPIIGMFFLSSMFRFANIYGLFTGALSGFAVGCWLSLGSFIVKPVYPKLSLVTTGCAFNQTNALSDLIQTRNVTTNSLHGFDRVYSISYMWLSPIGVLTTVGIGVIVSVIANFFIVRKPVDDSLLLYKAVYNRNKVDDVIE